MYEEYVRVEREQTDEPWGSVVSLGILTLIVTGTLVFGSWCLAVAFGG